MIVSCYFRLPHNQTHSLNEYNEWIPKFLENTPAPIIFFTTPDLIPWLTSMRPPNYPIQFITYNSIHEIESIQKYGFDFWVKQCELDEEKFHCPELLAIWNNVPAFVIRAAEIFIGNEPFIWAYAGCVRTEKWYPYLQTFGMEFSRIPKKKLLLQLLQPLPEDFKFFKSPDWYIAGGISAGYKNAWIKCGKHYDEMITKYVESNVCVSQDQYIWASCVQLHPEDFETVLPCPSPYPWFFFFKYLSIAYSWFYNHHGHPLTRE
jgi:hypothetical protein